jgi:hypothetical protein
LNLDAWMQTYSGRQFFPFSPVLQDIHIVDIAHHLSLQTRYNGACTAFYSVAQHSVLVSQVCKPEDALWGLLHDGSEFIFGDMPRPIKHSGLLEEYRCYEKALQALICKRYNLDPQEPESVKWADGALLSTEKRDLMRGGMLGQPDKNWLHGALQVSALSPKIIPWDSRDAEYEFMARYKELTTKAAPFTGTPYTEDPEDAEDGGW